MDIENGQEKSTRRPSIQSVARAIRILKCFEDHTELGLTEISRMVEIHKSTVFGLISTMEEFQLVEQDENSGKYRLGIELFRLGNKVNLDLRRIVSPYLDRMVDFCGETVNFVVPDGSSIVYIEKKESPHSMRIATAIGHREPMYRTATGKSMLAWMPKEKAQKILSQTKFEQRTEYTLVTEEAVLQELEEIRRRGYAMDREELEYGLVCLAVAVVGSMGQPVGAVSISGPASRMTEENCRNFSIALMDCANEISSRL